MITPPRTVVLTVAVGAVVVGAVFAGGFASGRATTPARSSDRAGRIRPGETVLHRPAVTDNNLSLRPTGITCGLRWVVGTHADLEAHGQYCRLGLEVTNRDATFHDLTTAAQRLVVVGGRSYAPSLDATRVERQPDVATIGARDVVDLDVWFDIPASDRVAGTRLVGDDDPTGINTTVTAPHPRGGIYVSLPAAP
ncbi:MAG: hypothetical protein ACQSGP_00735 [Frankia sp.]